MTTYSKIQLQALIAEALQISIEQITPGLAFGDLPEWDSMGHMEVMMLLESRFDVEINAETITQLTSIEAIHNYLLRGSDTE